MKQSKNRGTMLNLAIIWLAIILLGSFWLTLRGTSDPLSMSLMPLVPRGGEPVIVTFKVNNPSPETMATKYQFYANGKLVNEGDTTIAPESGKTYKYAYRNPLQLGEQLNFVVRTSSNLGNYEKVLSSPPYPPQVWSSFVSFATFSTSVMSSMSTMTYYQSAFGIELGLNVGIIVSMVLIILLIFAELSKPEIEGGTVARLGRLRIRFSTVTWILLIIFTGIIYTKVVMILSG
ncbi:MAG: hypothetical protein HW402_651 [Dehalococcoidales bacterium]|nr:hypothetical protein [Dehalococcoidales bacterium]